MTWRQLLLVLKNYMPKAKTNAFSVDFPLLRSSSCCQFFLHLFPPIQTFSVLGGFLKSSSQIPGAAEHSGQVLFLLQESRALNLIFRNINFFLSFPELKFAFCPGFSPCIHTSLPFLLLLICPSPYFSLAALLFQNLRDAFLNFQTLVDLIHTCKDLEKDLFFIICHQELTNQRPALHTCANIMKLCRALLQNASSLTGR